MADAAFTRVAALDELRDAGRLVVSAGDHAIALFYHEGEVFAVDNRCPHMGFPLADGTVDDGLLTCHWHHARFELAAGDTFDVWADDVQTYPVDVTDGEVRLDPDPEPDVPPAAHWRNRLADGLAEDLPLVMAKAVLHLDDLGEGFSTPLVTALDFGTTYRSTGWGSGLTVMAAMANLYDHVDHAAKLRAMYVGAPGSRGRHRGRTATVLSVRPRKPGPLEGATQRLVPGDLRGARRRRRRALSAHCGGDAPTGRRGRNPARGCNRPPLSRREPHARLREQGL